ncbi:hypothetical protein F2Q68_00046135 [Brassica cretica]|uniref:Uncharacterized protein n=1 Tax=Brassica cretica TaxID=69181 RepID=A0A8S9LKE7_BRACR|nr:hypothetical protein F2Q68_00046135 [Brassica cretica]
MVADQGDDYTHHLLISQLPLHEAMIQHDGYSGCCRTSECKADCEATKDANQENLQAPQNFPLAPFSIKVWLLIDKMFSLLMIDAS